VTPDPGPVVDLALAGPPLLGHTRLVCIDGPAGSGKTTVADLVAGEVTRRGLSSALVHMDDVYEGWTGLAEAGGRVRRWVVEPLAEGRAGEHPRYDWHLERYDGKVVVPTADIVVVEGVGSASLSYADRISVLVWVEAPEELRLRRGLDRDGPDLQPHWRRWLPEEHRLHDKERTRDRADVVVDGASGELRVVSRAGPSPHDPR
jgi:uridine kinase